MLADKCHENHKIQRCRSNFPQSHNFGFYPTNLLALVPCPQPNAKSLRPPLVHQLEASLQVSGWPNRIHSMILLRRKVGFSCNFCFTKLLKLPTCSQCPIMTKDRSCTLPKLIMISARPLEKRLKAFDSWAPLDVIFFNTTGSVVQINLTPKSSPNCQIGVL